MAFQLYALCPEPVPLQCNVDGIKAIASKLSRAAGLDSVNAAMPKAKLTIYGCVSAELQEEMVKWAECWPTPVHRGLRTGP